MSQNDQDIFSKIIIQRERVNAARAKVSEAESSLKAAENAVTVAQVAFANEDKSMQALLAQLLGN